MKKITESFSNYYLTFCIYALIGWLYEVFWMWFVVPPKHFINRGVLLGPFLPIYGFGMLLLLICLKSFMEKKHLLKNKGFGVLSTIIVITFIYTTIIEYTTPKIYSVTTYLQNYGIGLILSNIIGITLFTIFVDKTKIGKKDSTIILVFLAIWLIATAVEYISHYVMDTYFHTMLWDYTKDFLNVNKRINWDASRNFAIGGTFLLYAVQPKIKKLLTRLSFHQKLIITGIIGIPMILDFLFHVILKLV